MSTPQFANRYAAVVLLCMVVAIPIVRLHGQDKPQVAPPDKSDSFERDENGKIFRLQHHKIAGTNFQIAGVDLAANEEVLTQAAGILGKVETVATGDASAFLERACYRPMEENDSTRLIFIRGEVSPFFILSSENSAWRWKAPCKHTAKITRSIATASGLHLGQTEEQVIAIIGLPTRISRSSKNGGVYLIYEHEVKKKMRSSELAPYLQDELKQYPNLDQKTWIKNYGYYSLWESIHAKFVNNAMTNIEVSWSETY
jgi:hypothetical protein